MTLLRTYLVMAVLRGVATVMAVLVAITCVIEFVQQLNDVGTGDYGVQTALIYIALRVPQHVFQTLPCFIAVRPSRSCDDLQTAGTTY